MFTEERVAQSFSKRLARKSFGAGMIYEGKLFTQEEGWCCRDIEVI